MTRHRGEGFKIPYALFVALLTLIYFIIADLPEIAGTPVAGIKDAAYLAAYYMVIIMYQACLLCLLSVNRYIFAVCMPVLLIVTGLLTYFYITLDVTMSATVVGLIVDNDAATSSDFITAPVLTVAIGSLAASGTLIYVRFRHVRPSGHPRLYVAGAVIPIAAAYPAVPRLKSMVEARMPYSLYASARDYGELRMSLSDTRDTYAGTPASTQADSLTVVLVIGESVRADHLGINGYGRDTTPRMSAIDNLVSYPGITTEAFHTAMSLPLMLTAAEGDDITGAYGRESFIPLFNKAGYSTAWIANQEPLTSFVYFTAECDTLVPVYSGHSHYMYDKWLDGTMLDPLAELLDKPAPLKLIIMHTIGAHWWYNTHYTPAQARFNPQIRSRNVSMNTRAEMINSYDNCIIATDSFIADVIDMLADRRAILIYMSDHGEGLGEDGIYLHAAPNAGTSTIGTITWCSDSYINSYPERARSLRDNRDNRATSDCLFHTMLDCADIDTPAADRRLSLAGSR